MTANEALNGYFMSLSRSDKAELTRNLIINLEITPSTLNSWRFMKVRIPGLYRREINRIIGKDIFSDVSN